LVAGAEALRGLSGSCGWGQVPSKVSGDVILLRAQVARLVLSSQITCFLLGPKEKEQSFTLGELASTVMSQLNPHWANIVFFFLTARLKIVFLSESNPDLFCIYGSEKSEKDFS
jgi:hypothetical protein